MIQQNDSNFKSVSQNSLLTRSLSWIGVFSILSCNQVFAQTESFSDNLVPLPTLEAAPPATTQPSTDRLERLQRRLVKPKAQVVRKAAPQPRVSVYTPPQAVAPRSVPARKTAIQPTQDYNGAFIDPTDYNTGATNSYEPPSKVIFSPRSISASQRRTPIAQRQTPIATRGSSIRLSSPRKTQPNASWVNSRIVATTAILPVRANTNRIRYINPGRSPINRQIVSSSNNNNVVTLPKIPGSCYYNRTIRPRLLGNDNPNMIFPLPIPATITSLFGWRIHPITGERRFHAGTDLGADMGTPVVAAYSGNVATADLMGGYGLTVVLDHQQFDQQTLYAHLSEIFVQPGQLVEQGTVIGRVGSTGNSTGPHLHFEVRQLTNQGWVATDPGVQLQGALAQLVESMRIASAKIPN